MSNIYVIAKFTGPMTVFLSLLGRVRPISMGICIQSHLFISTFPLGSIADFITNRPKGANQRI